MKFLPTAIVLAAVLLAAIAGYALRTITEEDPDETAVLAAELRLVSLQDFGPGYSIDVDYPQLGLPLDSKVRGVVESDAAELKSLAQRTPPGSRGAAGSYSLSGGLTTAYLGRDVVSVGMVLSHYTGGAHGFTTAHGFNFDPYANREITLDTTLEMLGMSLQDLSDRALAQLKKEPWFSPDFNPKGYAPNPENFQTFTFTGESVVFTFAEYQVGPYAVGLVEVSFPRTSPAE